MNVWIYRLTREWTTYAWLCEACATERAAQKWTCERQGEVVGFGCDDCQTREQAA